MKLLYLILLFFTLNSLSQNRKMEITLNNGIIKSGVYKIKMMSFGFPSKTKIISKNRKEKYTLKDIKNITMFTKNDTIHFEVIQTKKYINSIKNIKKLAQIRFNGDKIKLYYVSEIVYQGGTVGLSTVGTYSEKYVKKINDSIAYNMGYIYGAGQRGIKKRVRDYFTDCPLLINKVDKNEIDKDETIQIVIFYEQKCR